MSQMYGRHILVVEDEEPIRKLVRFALEREDYHVHEACDAQEGRVKIAAQRPDLIVMDWMMPGLSGLDFARELKSDESYCDIPIIMLTARGEEEDKVRGLYAGCDDYLTKPFSAAELVARLHAVLRRSHVGGLDAPIEVGDISVDVAGQRVTIKGEPLQLGPTEYRLLHFFATHPERAYTREQVLDRVWGQNVYVEERTVDVHIRRLRKALAPHGCDALIQTVRGTGYRFSTRETA